METKATNARRSIVAITDQAVVSLTNFIMLASVARWADPHELGILALGIVGWRFAQGLGRTLGGQTMALRGDGSRVIHYSAVSVQLGWLAALSLGAFSLVMLYRGDEAGLALLALGASIPAMLLQDLLRWHSFSVGSDRRALSADLLVLLSVAGGLVFATLGDAISAWSVIALSGFGAGLSFALFGSFLLPKKPPLNPRLLLSELRTSRWFVADYLSAFAIDQSYLILGASLATVEQVGAMASMQSLLGPASVALLGLAIVSRSKAGAEYVDGGEPSLRSTSRWFHLAGIGVVILVASVVIPFREAIIHLIFGSSLLVYSGLAILAVLDLLVRSLRHIPQLRLQVRGNNRGLALAKAIAAPIAVVLGSIAMLANGGMGIGWAAVTMSSVGTLAVWTTYLFHGRRALVH